MMGGWISLHRDILDWEWYQDSKVLHLWIHLLLKANHEEGVWRGIRIKRGQLVTSLRRLSEETGLTLQEVRTALKKLEATHNVTQTPTHRFSLITVEKYSVWQNLSTGSNTVSNTDLNKLVTTNNNNNNINKDDEGVKAVFSALLSDDEWRRLDDRYEDLLALIDMVDDQVHNPSEIRRPYAYICRVADKKNWPRKRKSLFDWAKTI